jgi:hypothetical protein
MAGPEPSAPFTIASKIKPALYQKMLKDREVLKHASLDPVEERNAPTGAPALREYSFYAAMAVHADLPRTRRILTNYSLYSKIIPYVDKTVYSPITRVLEIEGGIWKWRLRSFIRFDEKSDAWIHYRFVGGHFTGLEGEMLFEPSPDARGTVVYMTGALRGRNWPPKLVIEQGAQIVFGFTAGRMRKYVESQEDQAHDGTSSQLPQPRSHL